MIEVERPPSSYILPQDCTGDVLRARKDDLARNRRAYQWIGDVFPGHPSEGFMLPRGLAKLPSEAKFSGSKILRLTTHKLRIVANSAWTAATARWPKNPSEEDYRKLLGFIPPPTCVDRWREDSEFAEQRLRGVNPMAIRRVESLDDDAMAKAADDVLTTLHGTTLRRMEGRGRLFETNYAFAADSRVQDQVQPGWILAAPRCLFFTRDDGSLMPLAIRLMPLDIDQDGAVFTPLSDRFRWLLARSHAQAADGHFHEAVSHLMETHMVTESMAVSVHRTLHPDHPIAQLLNPHFEYNLAIDMMARTNLLAPNGPIARAMAAGVGGALDIARHRFGTWSLRDCSLHEDLKSRGVDDERALPRYPYRDDAVLIWDAVEQFVEGIVELWYPEDPRPLPDGTHPYDHRTRNSVVMGDPELQAWVQELNDPQGAAMPGTPRVMHSRVALVHLLTEVIFRGSAQHAAVNNGQYACYGWVPNCPTKLRGPLPPDPDAFMDSKEFFRILPDRRACNEQTGMVWILSEPTENSLLRSGEALAFSPENNFLAYQSVGRFRRRLRWISEHIKSQNADPEVRPVPYTFLDPQNVDRSIAI